MLYFNIKNTEKCIFHIEIFDQLRYNIYVMNIHKEVTNWKHCSASLKKQPMRS